MSNNSIKAHKIAVAIVFLTCLILGQNSATAEQKPSDNWRVSPRLARTENPIAPDTDSVASGKKLYSRECLQCHGETGKGDGSMAAYMGKKVADLTSAEVLAQSDGALYTKIRTGRAPMPGFKNSLSA